MSRSLMILIVVFSLVGNSCKKSTRTMSATAILRIPWDIDSLIPPFTYVAANGVSILNADGIMVASKISGVLTDTAGVAHLYNRGWEAALFFNSATHYWYTAGIDTVSVNTIILSGAPASAFTHRDTAAVWNESTLNHWYVSGSGSIPRISQNISGSMPAFSGVLPLTISRAHGFSFTFDSSNTLNADSAFVIAIGRNPSKMAYSNVVGTRGGVAVIGSSVLGSFNNASPLHLTGYPVGPVYSGGYVIFVMYNHVTLTIGGKQFAFVKQREVIGIVNYI